MDVEFAGRRRMARVRRLRLRSRISAQCFAMFRLGILSKRPLFTFVFGLGFLYYYTCIRI